MSPSLARAPAASPWRTCSRSTECGRLLEDIVQNTPIRYYTSWGRLMAHVEPSVRPFGWPRRNNFLQPLFEAALRENVADSDTVDLWLGARLTGYEQAATGATPPSKWLVVDVADDELDAPYSAVYCDPVRPVLMIPLPYGHRRWEFKLNDTDDEAALTDPQRVLAELIAPRYGAAPLPRVLRSAVYLHHSRTAQRFRGAGDDILQMKYKPMPRYVHGAVVPYAGASTDVPLGRMFTQPAVENADGDRILLDEALGSSFAVLGLHADPATGLSSDPAAWGRPPGAAL